MSIRKLITSAALCGTLLLASAAPAFADCASRIRQAEREMHRAEAKHGFNSRQAENKRRHLQQVRAKCQMKRHHRW